ncbi:MAG: hypothetical protein WBM44_17780 [Waterburya sp.]
MIERSASLLLSTYSLKKLNLPPETLQQLVEAIALWISNNKTPQ